MSDNTTPRATGEAVADVLQGYANWYHDHVSRGGWANGSHVENKRLCEAARLVEMFGAHPAPRVGVTGTAEGGDDPKMLLYDLWITWNKLHHESNQVAARIAAIAASTPTRGSDE